MIVFMKIEEDDLVGVVNNHIDDHEGGWKAVINDYMEDHWFKTSMEELAGASF